MRKALTILALTIIVLSSGAHQTFASENIFQKTFSSIGNSLQRLYLRWVPGDKPGESVLLQTIQATQTLKTAQVTSQITADLLQRDVSRGSLKIDVKGPAQLQRDAADLTVQQEVNFSSEFTLQGTTLRLDADTKLAGSTFYFKLNQVPALPNVDLGSVTGKWYKTTNDKATQKVALTGDQKTQMQNALMQLWKSSKASSAKRETKNDHAVYVLDVTLSRQALQDYVNTVVEVQSLANPDQAGDITSKLKDVLSQNLDKIGDVKATLWVDRSTFYVRHAEIPIVYVLTSVDAQSNANTFGPLAALSQVDKANIVVTINLEDFNEPIQFVEPTGAQDANEVFSSFGKMMTPGKTNSEGTSELPTLTPQQRLQLQGLNTISPEQKQKFLNELGNVKKQSPAP